MMIEFNPGNIDGSGLITVLVIAGLVVWVNWWRQQQDRYTNQRHRRVMRAMASRRHRNHGPGV